MILSKSRTNRLFATCGLIPIYADHQPGISAPIQGWYALHHDVMQRINFRPIRTGHITQKRANPYTPNHHQPALCILGGDELRKTASRQDTSILDQDADSIVSNTQVSFQPALFLHDCLSRAFRLPNPFTELCHPPLSSPDLDPQQPDFRIEIKPHEKISSQTRSCRLYESCLQ